MTHSVVPSNRKSTDGKARRRTLTWCAALVSVVLVSTALPAAAVTIPANPPAPGFQTGMEIDGDKTLTGSQGPHSFDWADIIAGTVTPYSGPNMQSAGIVQQTSQVDTGTLSTACSGSSVDTSTTVGGQKLDDNNPPSAPGSAGWVEGWKMGGQSVTTHGDACVGRAAIEPVRVFADSPVAYNQVHVMLYQYFTRNPSGTGSAQFYTILEGGQAGRCDDFLLNFNFEPQDGSSSFAALSWSPDNGACTGATVWGPGEWVPAGSSSVATSSTQAQGANTDTTDAGAAGAKPSTFFETSVDLTAAGILPEDECATFTTTGFVSQTGNGASASLQDFVQYANPLTITNCNSIAVTKAAVPAGIQTPVTFPYTISQADLKATADGSLAGVSSTQGAITDLSASNTTISQQLAIGETQTWTPVLASPDYLVTEGVLPSGWTQKSVVCTSYDLFAAEPGMKTVTIWENGGPVIDPATHLPTTFSIAPSSLQPAGTPAPSCTITNTTTAITIVKDAVPNHPLPFTFTGTGPTAPGDFTLADPGSGTSNTKTFTGLTPGTYVFTEPFTAGWTLSGIQCTGLATPAVIEGSRLTLTVAAGEAPVCTFTNTQLGRVTIVKDAQPDDPRDFDFASDLGDFSLADGEQQTFNDVAPGKYSVTEDDVAGWTMSGLLCDDPTGNSTATGATASIDVAPGEHVICTYTNTLNSATLTLTKSWVNGNDSDAVGLTATGSRTLADATGSSTVGGATTPATLTVYAGETVDLNEEFTSGEASWYDTTLTCTDAAGLTYTAGGLSGVYTVPDDPDNVTCTFVNTRKETQLTLRKSWIDGAEDDTAVLSVSGTNSGSATSTASGASGTETDTTNAVTTTVYAGEEVDLAEELGAANVGGYTSRIACNADGLTSDPGGQAGTYVVPTDPSPVTCTIVNERTRTTLTLGKSWVDAEADDEALLTAEGSLESDTSTSIATGTLGIQNDLVNIATIEVLSGESVTLSEAVTTDVPGAYSHNLACSAGGLDYVVGTRDGTLTVPRDATPVACVFSNQVGRGTIVVVKNTVGGDDSFTFAGSWAGGGSFAVDTTGNTGSVTFTDVMVGTYSVSELVPDGWDLSQLACAGTAGSSATATVGTIVLTPGATVTCTFTNTQLGRVTIVKDAVPNDPRAFEFTGDFGSFSLVDDGVATASTTFADVTPGTYAVTETAVPGWTLTGLSCTDPSDDSTTAGATATIVVGPGEDITCIYTNTINTATLTLTKAWVDGNEGDAVALSAAGSSLHSTPADGSSTAPGTTADAVLTIYAGEAVDLSELYSTGNPFWYSASLTCTDAAGLTYSTGALRGSYLVPELPVDVTCTFTNTRNRTTVVLQKAWVDGLAGDTAALIETGSIDSGSATSTATGAAGTETDAAHGITIEALAGEEVALAETTTSASPGAMTSDLVCDGGALDYAAGAQTGALTIPSASTEIACTFTNTVQRGTIVVVKNAMGGDGTFTFNGTWDGASGFTMTTVDGAASTTFADVVIGSYTLEEVVPAGWDLADLDCVSTAEGGTTGGSIELTAGATVTCTVSNIAQPPLTIVKTIASGPTLVSGNVYEVSYDITVASESLAARTFSLDDVLQFGDGVTPVSVTATGPASIALVPGFTGQAPHERLVEDGVIPGNSTLTFTVTAQATVSGSSTASDRDCTLLESESGTGTLNSAAVTWSGGSETTTACGSIPDASLALAKVVSSAPARLGGSTYEISYDITVDNNGEGPDRYTLTDVFAFAPDVTVLEATVENIEPGNVPIESGFDGATNSVIATADIGAGERHVYRVTVFVDAAAIDSEAAADCVLGDETGTGLLNNAHLDGSLEAQACAPVPYTKLPPVLHEPPEEPEGPPPVIVPPNDPPAVPADPPPALAVTGSNPLTVSIAGGVLLFAGLVLLVRRRRRLE